MPQANSMTTTASSYHSLHTPEELLPLDLSLTPLPACHAVLLKRHYTNLVTTISQSTCQQIQCCALSRLARMMLIIRDYTSHTSALRFRGKLEDYDEEMESMVIDVVEAALTVDRKECGTWEQGVFASGCGSREDEVSEIMRELRESLKASMDGDGHEVCDGDAVLQRGRRRRGGDGKDKPLPDTHFLTEDIGHSIDWNRILLRSRSETDILHLSKDFEIQDHDKWEQDLLSRELEELDLLWPPKFKDPEPNVGRQRERRMTGPNSRLASVQHSRAGSRAASRTRKWTGTGLGEGLNAGLMKELRERSALGGNDSVVGSPVLSAKSSCDVLNAMVVGNV
ncbi:hypothetical protein Slin14017_G106870 [Septoria linicola]|nr:hypothetical protein Slin14017_G106870 [Septoria linicola]